MNTKNQKIDIGESEVYLVSTDIKQRVELFEYHFKSKHDLLISYKGPFDKLAIGNMSTYIREMLNFNEKIGKKIFKIFIEISQNIGYYSYEKNKYCKHPEEAGVGTIMLFETDSHFYIVAGNLIENTQVEKLETKCNLVSSLDIEGLRELRRTQLELPDSEKGGANIGLIHVALLSENKLEHNFSKLNELFSFFTISIKVNK